MNPYIPYPVRIDDIIVENDSGDLKTFKLSFLEKEHKKAFAYMPGQFAEISVPGFGESPIGIASSPTEEGYLLFTIKRIGLVTRELHSSSIGRVIGVRGPLGNAFPWKTMEGKNILIVGGGFAFTTLRSAIIYASKSENRSRFGKLTCIYGARSPGELLYKNVLKEWENSSEIETYITVDRGDENWKGRQGFVPQVVEQVSPSPDNTVALVCGPPAMIKFTMPVINKLGFSPEQIVFSLEMRMKCGIGKCGRCNIGPKYVCKHGPVFTVKELEELPSEY